MISPHDNQQQPSQSSSSLVTSTSTSTGGTTNTAIVPDILLSLTKDHRYIKQFTFLMSKALCPYLPTAIHRNSSTDSTHLSNNDSVHTHDHAGDDDRTSTDSVFSLDVIQPEVSLLARLFHAYIIFKSDRSIGQEYLYLSYRNNTHGTYRTNRTKKVRGNTWGKMDDVNVTHESNVDIRKYVFVLLYTISPYLIQRAGRGGWDELKTLLHQCWIRARRRAMIGAGQGEEIYSVQSGGSSNNPQPLSLQQDRLRGIDRRQAYEEMRRRMIERSIEEEERER